MNQEAAVTSTATQYAVIESGIVVNIVMWDGASDWAPPDGSEEVKIPAGTIAGIGYTYAAGVFTAPAAISAN
ncbi:hypothetical protein [Obesumbacterium proteus]|uniref:Uncharacterized protein n=1 Tax=Obesumbacterium proteus ATCC 12841 TaxID=1354268 RepID=A0AA91EI09_9GAMM|nr:hypothetical protein [Obesumbacterium proteus]AMO79706.1 hypothetical protein DSM2777_00685 [Obesumbacterium proteus]OAT58967.1 hypothetical protein M993_02270 [Obesumbacterium proteus ATCC 12841]